jgi:hypothetical protein
VYVCTAETTGSRSFHHHPIFQQFKQLAGYSAKIWDLSTKHIFHPERSNSAFGKLMGKDLHLLDLS